MPKLDTEPKRTGIEWSALNKNHLSDEAKTQIKRLFVNDLRLGCTLNEAADLCDVPLRTLRLWGRLDPQFLHDYREAEIQGRLLIQSSWKDDFLDIIRRKFNLGLALRYVGISRADFALACADDPEFARAFDDARQDALDNVEGSMFDKAISGQKNSETAGIMLLNAHRPNVYKGRNAGALGDGGGTVTFNLVIGAKPQAKQLPAQTGNEIVIDDDHVKEADG